MKFEIPKKNDSEMLFYIWKIIDLPYISKRDLFYKISFDLFLFSPENARSFISRCIEKNLLIKNNKILKLGKNLDEKLKIWHKNRKTEILEKIESSERISEFSKAIERDSGFNFNILMKAFLEKGTLNRAASILDSSINVRIFDKKKGVIEADVKGIKESNYYIKIDINNKALNHNCHDFITRRADNKKFCKHLVKLFLLLKKKDSDSTDYFLNNISENINQWDFSD